jgi:hypothetical protein
MADVTHRSIEKLFILRQRRGGCAPCTPPHQLFFVRRKEKIAKETAPPQAISEIVFRRLLNLPVGHFVPRMGFGQAQPKTPKNVFLIDGLRGTPTSTTDVNDVSDVFFVVSRCACRWGPRQAVLSEHFFGIRQLRLFEAHPGRGAPEGQV